MHYLNLYLYLSIFLSCFFNNNTYAQKIIHLPAQEGLAVGYYAQYLEDQTLKLTIDNVRQTTHADKWQTNKKSDVVFGYSTASCWVRFRIKHTQPNDIQWLLVNNYSWSGSAEVYIEKEGKIINTLVVGNRSLRMKERYIKHPYMNLPIQQKDTTTYTYYIRADNQGSILFPLRIHTKDTFQYQARNQDTIYGILFGIELFIIVNCLFVYFNIRDKAYLWYIGYIVSSLLMFISLSGYIYVYVPFLDKVYFHYPVVLELMSIAPMFGIIFTMNFLQTKTRLPQYHRIFQVMLGITVVMGIMALFTHAIIQYQLYGTMFIVLLLMFVLAGRSAWRKGMQEARFYVLGYLSYFLLSLPSNLFYTGTLMDSFFVKHSIEFGIVLEMIFLAYSLADKTRLERAQAEKERNEAQAEALRIQKEANEKLEEKVQQRTLQLSETNEELNQANEELNTTLELIALEKQKSDNLLLNILPEKTAAELKETGTTQPHYYELTTVLFTDFKGFTTIAEKSTPQAIIENLNHCFLAFDEICEKHKLEKIKTIGDAYMAVGGIPIPNTSNPIDAVNAALEIQDWMQKWIAEKIDRQEEVWEVRIGVHTGQLIAGVVGKTKFAYDVWGDAVNLASRMESSGQVGKVNISGATYALVKEHFDCTHRGKIAAKNKGEVDMYFVNHKI